MILASIGGFEDRISFACHVADQGRKVIFGCDMFKGAQAGLTLCLCQFCGVGAQEDSALLVQEQAGGGLELADDRVGVGVVSVADPFRDGADGLRVAVVDLWSAMVNLDQPVVVRGHLFDWGPDRREEAQDPWGMRT